jgi:hypothetical protein
VATRSGEPGEHYAVLITAGLGAGIGAVTGYLLGSRKQRVLISGKVETGSEVLLLPRLLYSVFRATSMKKLLLSVLFCLALCPLPLGRYLPVVFGSKNPVVIIQINRETS